MAFIYVGMSAIRSKVSLVQFSLSQGFFLNLLSDSYLGIAHTFSRLAHHASDYENEKKKDR